MGATPQRRAQAGESRHRAAARMEREIDERMERGAIGEISGRLKSLGDRRRRREAGPRSVIPDRCKEQARVSCEGYQQYLEQQLGATVEELERFVFTRPGVIDELGRKIVANYNAGRAAWGAWGFNAEMVKRSLRKDLDPNKHRERSEEIWIKTQNEVLNSLADVAQHVEVHKKVEAQGLEYIRFEGCNSSGRDGAEAGKGRVHSKARLAGV